MVIAPYDVVFAIRNPFALLPLHHDWIPPKPMTLRMIFCCCVQVGESRFSDRYYTKDIALSSVVADFVRKHNEDFVGVELLDEEEHHEIEVKE